MFAAPGERKQLNHAAMRELGSIQGCLKSELPFLMSSWSAQLVLQSNGLRSNRVAMNDERPSAPVYMSASVANGLFYKGPELVQHVMWPDTLMGDVV